MLGRFRPLHAAIIPGKILSTAQTTKKAIVDFYTLLVLTMEYDDWQKLPYGAPELARLKAFEDWLGCVLPDDFRRWLEVVNGGSPTNPCIIVSEKFGVSCLDRIYGLNRGAAYLQLDRANRILKGNLNFGLVAFGSDAGGNQFTISIRGEDYGAVIFWDHETADEYVLGSNFAVFHAALRAKEVKPLDEIDAILREDDPVKLERWLDGKDLNAPDEYNRSVLENAALYGSISCIRYLHQLGASPRNSIEWLKKRMKYYPEDQATIDMIQALFGNGVAPDRQRQIDTPIGIGDPHEER